MDAVDTLFYENRRANDMDAESGIETGDNESVTSSEYAAAAAILPTSFRRDNATAVNVDAAVTSSSTSGSDDVGEFIKLMMVPPPPSPASLDEPDVVVPPPMDLVDYSSDLSPTADCLPRSLLPPLVELPEDDLTSSVLSLSSQYDANVADRLTCVVSRPSPSSNVDELTRAETKTPRNILSSCDDLTQVHHEQNVDENSNCVLVSADGVVAAEKSSHRPVPAKRSVKTAMANGVHHSVDVIVSRTPTTTENVTSTKTSAPALPVSGSANTTARSYSVPQPSTRHFSGETETYTSPRKKTASANIWKRFLRRDLDSSGVSASTGISWSLFPRRRSITMQSRSVADSISTIPRHAKNQPSASKTTTSAAAKLRPDISLPFDFRDLTTGVSLIRAQRIEEQLLSSTGRKEVNQNGVLSAGQESSDDEDVWSASDDDLAAAGRPEKRPKAMTRHDFRDKRGPLSRAFHTLDPRIFKSPSVGCVASAEEEKRKSSKNARRTYPSSYSPPAAKRTILTSLAATLPRVYTRSQASYEVQATSTDRWSDPLATAPDVECHDDDDDLTEVTRSEYLQKSVTGTVRPSPAADTTRLLRQSMSEKPTSTSTPPLFVLIDSILTLDEDDLPPKTVAGGCFDTFKGALQPVRWSDEDASAAGSRRARSLSFGSTAASPPQMPAYVDVRPPATFLDVRPTAALVAAPRSDKQQHEKPEKPVKPQLLRQSVGSHVTTASDVIPPSQRPHTVDSGTINFADVMRRPEAEVNTTYECRMSLDSANSDDVFVGDEATNNDDVDDFTPTDDYSTTVGQRTYDVIKSVVNKTYGRCACDEAICDIEAMMMALERLRYSSDVSVPTTLLDADGAADGLSTSVRQLVTDAKNLVARAMSSSSDREERLRVLVEATMHTLAAVFLHCCRLVAALSAGDVPPSPGAVADVADNVLEAAQSLRTTLEAARAVLEAGPDVGEVERTKNEVLATAAVLAKSLAVLVHIVKTV